MGKVEKEIIALESDASKINYLNNRIKWLTDYESVLKIIINTKYLDPYNICELEKPQIIKDEKISLSMWIDINTIITPDRWAFYLRRGYRKVVSDLKAQYGKDRRLNFLNDEIERVFDLVRKPYLYNHNPKPFHDFKIIEKAAQERLSEVQSLMESCLPLIKIIQSESSEKEKIQPSKEESLKKVEAFTVLEMLETIDENKLDENDIKIMKHASFKGYRSTYLKKFKGNFSDIFDELLQAPHIPLDDFYRRCNSPSQFYNKALKESFRFACNNPNGAFYEKCTPKKLRFGDKRVNGKKIKIMFFFK